MDRYQKWRSQRGVDPKKHQEEAVQWCLDREKGRVSWNDDLVVRGGILADEMGLGKTFVMLGLLVANFTRQGTLIIVPRSILYQWEGIIKKFFGHKPVVYHGAVHPEDLHDAPIVLTTYGTAVSRSLSLRSRKWGRLICDEAHHLRNRGNNYTVVRLIQARRRWMLTGTPIQNSTEDIKALFTIVGLGYLTSDSLDDAMENFLLRRTKADVGIKLPALRFHDIQVEWEDEDEKVTAAAVHNVAYTGGLNEGELAENIGHSTFVRYLRAKQMCLYPRLLDSIVDVYESSKLDTVANLIRKRRHNGRPKLVFAYFHHEIDELKKRLAGMSVGILDGRTTERSALLASGQTAVDTLVMLPKEIAKLVGGYLQYQVLIVQIQTACEGLNLQQFKEIYFTGPHWNPAVEDQAVARCHRIGQKDEIDVFRFTMAAFKVGPSLDLYIQKKQGLKREMMLD
ncbi:MAG: hypothetical protein CMF69_11545 [Magnetovibrio sp.]|nr:hypothetical protein [Magnetovibrio sp.]